MFFYLYGKRLKLFLTPRNIIHAPSKIIVPKSSSISFRHSFFTYRNCCLNPFRSSFHSRRSTTIVLVHITDDVRSAMDLANNIFTRSSNFEMRILKPKLQNSSFLLREMLKIKKCPCRGVVLCNLLP